MRTTPLGLCLLLAATPLAAQQVEVRNHLRVQEYLALLTAWADAKRAYEGIPGVSMAVVHD